MTSVILTSLLVNGNNLNPVTLYTVRESVLILNWESKLMK
jgi:hypothetical protein